MGKQLPVSPIDLRRPIAADPTRYFSAEEVDKSKRYVRPLQRASLGSLVVSAGVVAAMIASRFPGKLIDKVGVDGWALQVVLVLASIVILTSLADIPISVWKTFVHETKWGFNKQTPVGFVVDEIKNALVYGLVIISAMVLPVWALIRATDLWWLWGGLALMGVSLVLSFLFPIVIMPLFNKFTPLADEGLRERLSALARRAGVNISEFLVMDASKRSTKDNAFFAGMGKTRRVVIYDNMLELAPENIEVVVAHEIGHWRRGHIVRNMVMGVLQMPLTLGLVALIVGQGWFLRAAGVTTLGDPAALPAVMVAVALVFMLMRTFDAWISRWFEREADFDALELTRDPEAFAAVWHRMVDRNLPDITPSWWKRSRASHPPVVQRLAHGEAWAAAQSPIEV